MKSEQSQFGTPVDTQHPLGGGFDCDLMELKLLRDEIENLQFELAERDRQMPSTHGNKTDEMTEDSAELEALVEQFEARMKEMARELESSEDRIRTLNDLLQACEEANIAERDERQGGKEKPRGCRVTSRPQRVGRSRESDGRNHQSHHRPEKGMSSE